LLLQGWEFATFSGSPGKREKTACLLTKAENSTKKMILLIYFQKFPDSFRKLVSEKLVSESFG
jgi:hypothetical protein